MKNVWKRTVSLFLAIVMILGNVPVNALATDTVEPVACDHVNAQSEQTDATCGADGCIYWTCPDCEETWEEAIPAMGHAYNSEEVDGMIVYTCARCSDSYSEPVQQEPVQQEPVQQEPVQQEPVQQEPVQQEPVQQEPVQQEPAFFALAPESRATTWEGYVWVDADSNTEPMDLIGVAANGGIRDAVLRAVNKYDAANPGKYMVCYTPEGGTTINVAASYRELLGYIDEATELANKMKDSVSGDTKVPFEIKDASGALVAVANVGFRSFKTLESADISLNVKYEAETAPDDLQTIIGNMVEERAKVNGLTLAQLRAQPQSITVEVQEKNYVLPGLGQRDNVYTNIIKAVVTEGMTGEKATIYGGTVTLRNSTPKYDVTYYASEEDWAAGKAYAEESQFKGLDTPVPVNPVRTHYTFLGWLPVNADGKLGETAGVVTPIAGDAKYVAAWEAEEDNHTPGEVANNGVKDKIDDRDQEFVVTYYDEDGTTKITDRNVAYGGYLTHPNKAEVTKEGFVLKQWNFVGGQSGFIIKSNAAYKAVWEPVWTVTYTDDDGTVYDDFTQYLKNGAVIRHSAEPTREGGWKFGGWEYVGEGEEPATAKANVTFKANWIKLHTVTFYNNETPIGTSLVVEDGNTIKYPAAPEAPEGFVFGGWVVKQDGDETTAPTVAKSDLDIYAKWLQRFTITYTDGVEDDVVFEDFTREVTEGQHVLRPAVPALRDGYTFAGWTWVGEGEEPETITRNETYQAQWKDQNDVEKITITFTDGVEDEELFENITLQIAQGVSYDYPEITVTREHYDFGGWALVSEDADGNQTHAVIWNKRPILTYTDGEDGNVFEPKSFEVSYNSLIRHPGISDILPDGREGYVLDSWVTADGTEAPTWAIADVTYNAVWKKMNTITFTDGVEGEEVFADFTEDFKEGANINARVPADREGYVFQGWEKVDDTTYQATWKQVAVTVTYGHVQDDGTVLTETRYLDVPEDTEGEFKGVSDVTYVAPAQNNSKKIYMGLYPVVTIDGVNHWELVYASAVARSVSPIVHVPLGDTDGDGVDEIHAYAQKHDLPGPVDPTIYKFTGETRLYHLELPDEDSNGVMDGKYKRAPGTGSVPVGDNGKEILEFVEKAVSTTYKWYDYRNNQVTGKTSYYPYDEDYALNPGDVKYPDYDNDGVVFVKWVHHPDPGFEDITEGYVTTYHMKGEVEFDINNNGIYDVNENVGVVIVVNGDEEKTVENESLIGNEITITLSAAVAGKTDPALVGAAFLLDTKNGTNIEIGVDGEKGYAIKSVQMKKTAGNKELTPTEISGGDNKNVKSYKLTDASANNNTKDTINLVPEYWLTIYLDKLETKESDLVFDPSKPLPEFTVQKVYESVVNYPKFDSTKGAVISYVAREAQEDVPVSIEPLFQWVKDNYGSYGETMVGLIDDNLASILKEAGMEGLLTVDSSTKTHYFHVKLEKKTAFVGDSISTPVKTAQDIANSHVNAYINDLVWLMKTSGGDTEALEEHIAGLIGLLSDIQQEANSSAMIRPFGYNAKGEDVINESVVINVGGTIENGEIVGGKNLYTGNVKITDLRAPTNLTANGASVTVTYGTKAADTELKNKAGVVGAHLHVSYNDQAATTYPAGVAFPGSQTNRPANATINLTINRQVADVQVPAKVVKEHNSSYEGQRPDPTVLVGGKVVGNVDVISVIAGVDLNNMDIDLQKSLDNMVTVKNIDPVAWIKLPGNLLTHVAMVKKLDVDTSKFVNKMLEGKNLPAADLAKINELLNQFLNKNKVTCTLDEAIHLLEMFMPNAGEHQAKIEKALNAVKGTAEGNVKVTFSGGYPEDPGFFLNMGIVTDSNYVHGVSADKNGKDFGVILNCPVLTMYNNGIQLVSDEVPGVHNVYTLENDGKTHALRVEGYEEAEIFYYGFDSGLAVHYEGDGQTPPAKAGMYLVSAYVHDETSGKYMSDMAIMLIGVERTTTTVKGATVEYDGNSHKLEVITVDEEGENVGRTIISGTIDKPANAGLRDLRGLVNVDFPETIDNLWVHAVDHLESKFGIEKLPDTIQAAELTPEQTVEFLNYCKTKVENKEFDNVLVNKVQEVVEQTLDSLISAMNEIIGHTNGQVVTIQFKNDIGYVRHGVYLYHAIATDIERNQLYIPSAESGILIIHAPEEDFEMVNQEVPYNGKEQLPEIHDETGREQFMMIYNQGTLSFILGQDGKALMNKLGISEGITVATLLEKGVDKISGEIVDGMIASADAILKGIHKEDSVLYQEAKDRLNAHVAVRGDQIVNDLKAALADISTVVNEDTKLYFDKKPVNVGNYQVHAFSFGIAHEEATFKIIPAELTITADSDEIFYGDAVPSDIGVTYEGFVNGEDESVLTGSLVITHEYEQGMQAGEYDITPSGLEADNYKITYVPGVLTVNGAELTITANSCEITYGDAAPEMDVTYTGFVNGDTEAVLNGTLKLEHEYVQGKDVGEYTITPSGLTSDKYIISFEPGTLKVVEKQITEEDVALGEALTYNGSLQTQEVVGTTDGVTFEVTGNTGTDAGEYTLTVTGTGNYTGSVDLKWTIAQKKLTDADIVLGETLTYNGKEQTKVVTGHTDDVTFEVTGNTGTDAGAYVMTVTGTGNYTGVVSEPWTIAKAALTVTANSYEIICGDAAPTMEATYDGFQDDDTVADLGGELVFAHDYTQDAAAAGEYTITPSGLTSGNYEITFVNGTLTVKEAKPVDVYAYVKEKTKLYTVAGVAIAEEDISISSSPYVDGLIPDEATYTITDADGKEVKDLATALASAGTYTITPCYNNLGYEYVVTVHPITLHVLNRSDIVVSAFVNGLTQAQVQYGDSATITIKAFYEDSDGTNQNVYFPEATNADYIITDYKDVEVTLAEALKKCDYYTITPDVAEDLKIVPAHMRVFARDISIYVTVNGEEVPFDGIDTAVGADPAGFDITVTTDPEVEGFIDADKPYVIFAYADVNEETPLTLEDVLANPGVYIIRPNYDNSDGNYNIIREDGHYLNVFETKDVTIKALVNGKSEDIAKVGSAAEITLEATREREVAEGGATETVTINYPGLTYTITDSEGNPVADLTTALASKGTYTITPKLPDGMSETDFAGVKSATLMVTDATNLFDIKVSRMELGNALAMDFAFLKSDIDESKDYYVQITKTFADGRNDRVEIVPKENWGTSGNYYYARLQKIAAKEMADTIHVQVFFADGTVASTVREDSIRTYAMRGIPQAPEKSRTLMVDMLNYGAAAQTYFTYNVDDLANNELSEEQQSYATGDVTLTNKIVKGANYVGTRLLLDDSIQFQVKFNNIDSSMYAVVSFADHRGTNKTVRIEGSEFIEGGTIVVVDEILTADYKQMLDITVYSESGDVVANVKDSVESYLARASSNNIYQKIAKFVCGAYNYFH